MSRTSASRRPNLLFLMADQMQGCVLDPGHACQTPHFDRLQARGLRFARAYTPSPICSPARASLMTGLLPHNHNVWTVTHTVRDDRAALRAAPHWAQRLQAAGYATGYFGKWHVERSHELARFGWTTARTEAHPEIRAERAAIRRRLAAGRWRREGYLTPLPGYAPHRFYGVTELAPDARDGGLYVRHAARFLETALAADAPWACFVSVLEPHDPFVCGEEAFARYDAERLPLSPSWRDDLAGRPELYRRARRPWAGWTPRQHREAAACYYASITEIDHLFGRLLDQVAAAGQMDDTLVVLTSDHGEALGAHGLYCKNVSAAEEIYRIPLVLAGPGVPAGRASVARVGLHDLHPTLLELLSLAPAPVPDSASFAPLLRRADAPTPTQGYAEYEGTRFQLTQRVVWDDPWKFVFNGFAQDELYRLDSDPHEMVNLLTQAEAYADPAARLTRRMWDYVRRTNDETMLRADYPVLRIAAAGPAAT